MKQPLLARRKNENYTETPIRKIFRLFNITIGIEMFVLGIVYYFMFIGYYHETVHIENIYVVIDPVFMIIFSSILIMAELKINLVLNYLNFFENPIGIAFFTLYIATNVG